MATPAARTRPFRRILLAWLPALLYMALIWQLSSMPITLPMASLPFRDKLAHIVEYAMLGLLAANAVRGTWPALSLPKALFAAALLTSTWGYLDEVHQAFVPGRHASAFDLLADVVGAVLGVAAYGAVVLIVRKRLAARE
jgi:VanZ family protein